MPLSLPQYRALRMLNPDDTYCTGIPARNTLHSLKRQGLAYQENGEWFATEAGLRRSRRYVEQTGNGPEDLKAKLRFLW